LICVTNSTAAGASGCCVRSRPIADGVNLQEPRERKYNGRYRDHTAWDAQIANQLAGPDRQEPGSNPDRLRWDAIRIGTARRRLVYAPAPREDVSGRLRPRHRARAAAPLLTAQDRRTLGTIEETSLPRERYNVGRDIFSLTPTHRKIHLCVRTNERSHEIILVESVFATNYFKGRRVCDDAPRTSANDVTCRASILSYMPATLNVSSERRCRYKQQRDASSKTKTTTLHKVLRSYSGQVPYPAR
jgi:hypothetical protein